MICFFLRDSYRLENQLVEKTGLKIIHHKPQSNIISIQYEGDNQLIFPELLTGYRCVYITHDDVF